MNIPLINSLNVNDINTSLIAIRKNMQKTSSGTEKLQDVDVNVNIAHNSLYCAADSTVIKGATLFQGCSIKVLFTSAITGSDSSTPLVINYNDVNIPVKTGKNGSLADFVAYNTGSSFVYCQAYTTLELLFDGNDFIIMGNPVVISNADYTIYADGKLEYITIHSVLLKEITETGTQVFSENISKYKYVYFEYYDNNTIIGSGIILATNIGVNVISKYTYDNNLKAILLFSFNERYIVIGTLTNITKVKFYGVK